MKSYNNNNIIPQNVGTAKSIFTGDTSGRHLYDSRI